MYSRQVFDKDNMRMKPPVILRPCSMSTCTLECVSVFTNGCQVSYVCVHNV